MSSQPYQPAKPPGAGFSALPAGSSLETRAAVYRVLIVLTLWAWLFWPELCRCGRAALRSSSAAHALALPVGVGALLYLRRRWLAREVARGSVWGVLLLAGSLVLYGLSNWPFDFQYARQALMVPVLGAAVLAVTGGRVLKRCLPMLMLAMLAVPIGNRVYARLVIRPETYTLTAARALLDPLPGVDVTLEGPDLHYRRANAERTIALGESYRGAALLLACLSVCVFVVFSRVRPFWQAAVAIVLIGPIVLLGNLVRVLTWGLVSVYAGCAPTSGTPRVAAAFACLLTAYVLSSLLCAVLASLVIEEEEETIKADGMQEDADA